YALVMLGLGGVRGYRKICKRLLSQARSTADPDVGAWVAWICALWPHAVADRMAPVQLAMRALAHHQGKGDELYAFYCCTLGAALFRAGRYDKAIEEILRRMQARR